MRIKINDIVDGTIFAIGQNLIIIRRAKVRYKFRFIKLYQSFLNNGTKLVPIESLTMYYSITIYRFHFKDHFILSFAVRQEAISIALKEAHLEESNLKVCSSIYLVLYNSSIQYPVSLASFKAISSLAIKSFLPCAYWASCILAPMLVPLLPI